MKKTADIADTIMTEIPTMNSQKDPKDKKLILGLVVILFIGAFAVILFTSEDSVHDQKASDVGDVTRGKIVNEEQEQSTGAITGQGSYPSESLPNGYTVCARPQDGGEDICTDDFTGVDYSLELPVGDYTVYAISMPISYVAYYNQCAITQLNEDCGQDNEMDNVVITVEEGSLHEGVNPSSWYGPLDYEEFISR